MSRPLPRVNVQSVGDRRGRATKSKERRPWIVRWTVDGEEASRSFRTRVQADDFRGKLATAAGRPIEWDPLTKLPVDWTPQHVPTVADVAREMIQDEWADLAPNSRRSLGEALTRLVEATAEPGAPAFSSKKRTEFRKEMNRYWEARTYTPTREVAAWLARWSPTVDSLSKERLSGADRALRVTDAGTARAATTYQRYRSGATKCLAFAVEQGYIEAFEWPATKRGVSRRKKRKSQRAKTTNRLQDLPNRDQVFAILDAMQNSRRESLRYRAMTAVAVFGGLRPSEVVVLEVGDISKTRKGQPFIKVEKAWNGTGLLWGTVDEDVALPKTGETRKVMVPQRLVDEVEAWKEVSGISSGPLFLDEKGEPPTNWGRALAAACRKVGVNELTAYGLRHTNATMQMEAGVPLGVIAQQLGNSVEVLVVHYLGWLQGSPEASQQLFEDFLGT